MTKIFSAFTALNFVYCCMFNDFILTKIVAFVDEPSLLSGTFNLIVRIDCDASKSFLSFITDVSDCHLICV